ncbi:MAG: transposase, partial [Verrucomicrobia bacterium]|nr:transposase [Verrucomicrobiota bacterium]
VRVEFPGAIYHVMNRGDRREPIVRDDRDRAVFLATLGETCQKTGWEVLAWCLMNNHFHLVVETPRGNLVAGMKWFLGTYTARFNRRHKLVGHLFSGRYKALVIEGGGAGYLRTVCQYVHLNPVRAGLIGPGQRLQQYCWSSYRAYLGSSNQRPSWLRVDRLFGELGIPEDSVAGRRQFQRSVEQIRQLGTPERVRLAGGDWCLGDEQFRRELLEQMIKKMGRHHGGPERLETEERRAERIMREELERRRWNPLELPRRPKGDLEKVKIARRLRAETTMTLEWIAVHLSMGAGGSVANCLRRC